MRARRPDVGWFAYSPLTAKAFSKGHSTDYWTLSLAFEWHWQHCHCDQHSGDRLLPAMQGHDSWKDAALCLDVVVTSFLVVIAMPPFSACQIMLILDRYLGAKFFDTQAGGSAVLWQHFFWIFGHPEVYILVLPGFAIASEVIPVFSRKPIFGYPIMVAATVSIAFISLGVWAHHMFTVGMTSVGNTFFAISTMIIAVPTGIKIFNWLGTMYGGKIRLDLPMLFCIAFLFQFLIAGLTGVMLAVTPFDWQLSDSYFVVAHFHYVLIGGLRLSYLRGIYYWYPKAFGKNARRKTGPLALLAVHGRLPCDVRSRSTSRAFWECRGGSSPMRRTAGGRSGTRCQQSASSLQDRRHPLLRRQPDLIPISRARRRATIHGTHGPWSGRRPRRRRNTISIRYPRSAAAGPCGI